MCWLGCPNRWPTHSQAGSRVWHYHADCVGDEEQDGGIVESARHRGVWVKLGETPGNEG
jgi:hypothetical protein